MKQFWMVWCLGGQGAPTFRHESESRATCEAERLASLSPGSTFVVLEAVAARKSDTMQRVDLRDGADLPF